MLANAKVSAGHIPYPMLYAVNETLIINSTVFAMDLFWFAAFALNFHF